MNMDEINNFKSDHNNCISVYIPAEFSNEESIYKLKCERSKHENACIIHMINDIIDLVQTHKSNTSIVILMHPTRFYGFTNYIIKSYKFIIDNKFHGVH